MKNSVLIRGIKIYSFRSKEDIVDYVKDKNTVLIAVNAEKILHATHEIKGLINQNIGYTDGSGAVWALKRKGLKDTVKIPGCELWLDIISQTYKSKSFYLVGGTEEVIQSTIKKLRSDFEGVNIKGYRNGYIKDDQEFQNLFQDVCDTQPDVVFVAMGSPKQEEIILSMQSRHPALYQGLGGSFDVYVGKVDRAPDWWVSHHLEWAYRLIKQPSRIKRQIHLVKYFWWILWNKL